MLLFFFGSWYLMIILVVNVWFGLWLINYWRFVLLLIGRVLEDTIDRGYWFRFWNLCEDDFAGVDNLFGFYYYFLYMWVKLDSRKFYLRNSIGFWCKVLCF